MKIVIYGSSVLSSYWNGAATYYRGVLKALAAYGHDIYFFEPDVLERQRYRDIDPPAWCHVVVYPATPEGMKGALAGAGSADVIIKTSGVGYADEALLEGVLAAGPQAALRVWWDVDAPATLAEVEADAAHPLRLALDTLDLVLTYGGGDAVVEAYRLLGARACIPIYNALDPETHHPVPAEPRLASELTFLGNRLPDREARVDEFFLKPAALLPDRRFLLGGSGWQDKAMPPNVTPLGHVGAGDHNAANVSARAVLNINRASMAATGFSPPTRIFEAAGAGACLITDDWPGIDMFLKPGEEILIARDGQDVVGLLAALSPEEAAAIGRRALERVFAEHTYDRRAAEMHTVLDIACRQRRKAVAA